MLPRMFAQQINAMFERDLAASKSIDLPNWQRRSLLLRLKEWAASLGQRWL